jgi:hypothetical protein
VFQRNIHDSLHINKFNIPIQCAMKSVYILNILIEIKAKNPSRKIETNVIYKSRAMIYFDETIQEVPSVCEAKGLILL